MYLLNVWVKQVKHQNLLISRSNARNNHHYQNLQVFLLENNLLIKNKNQKVNKKMKMMMIVKNLINKLKIIKNKDKDKHQIPKIMQKMLKKYSKINMM